MANNFDRNIKGTHNKDASIYSILHGTNTILLEDELNESQWNQIERNASLFRDQYSSGFLKDYTIDSGYQNFFSITSSDNSPLSMLIDGYYLEVGNNGQGMTLPDGLEIADNRVIFKLNSVGTDDRTDLVVLEAWFETILYNENLKKFGGVDTEELTNNMYDSRAKEETSRRIQFRWRIRTLDGKSSMIDVTALSYDGTDSGVVYDQLKNIYIADTGIKYNTDDSVISTGIVYCVPLFTINRSASDLISLGNITNINNKISIGGSSAGTGLQKNGDIISISNTGVVPGQYTSVTVNAQGQVTTGKVLTASDLPTLSLSKISDAGTAASKNVGIAPGNVPILDINGKIDSSILPQQTVSQTYVVSSEAAMLALSAHQGDIAIRTDESKTYVLTIEPASTLGNWQEMLTPTNQVTSVAGRTGAVVLTPADVGLANVANESKTTMFTSPAFTGIPTAPTAVSTDNSTQVATTAFVKSQGAAALNSPTFTGIPSAPTAAVASNSTQIATTAFVKSQNYLTGNQNISISGDAAGSGTTSINLVLSDSGVTVGTYPKVSVDSKGRVISGSQLTISDIPALTLSKISDAGTAASRNIGTGSGNIPILDINGKLSNSIIPAVSITDTFVVNSDAAMTALIAQQGDVAIRTDLNKSFILKTDPASTLANWQELLSPLAAVTSVAGRTGAITLTSSDVGLGNVTNESKITMFTNTALTGVPTAPTAAASTNNNQIATTAFVKSLGYLTSSAINSASVRADSTNPLVLEIRTSEPASPAVGQIWLRSDL